MTKPYEARVRRGAAFLDKKRPRWWNGGEPQKINLATLNLGSPYKCVLGQLWAGSVFDNPFDRGTDALGLSVGELFPLGFDRGNGTWRYANRMYKDLTRRWVEEIENRRKEAGIS